MVEVGYSVNPRHHLGLRPCQAGEQWDDEDGLETIFEVPA